MLENSRIGRAGVHCCRRAVKEEVEEEIGEEMEGVKSRDAGRDADEAIDGSSVRATRNVLADTISMASVVSFERLSSAD